MLNFSDLLIYTSYTIHDIPTFAINFSHPCFIHPYIHTHLKNLSNTEVHWAFLAVASAQMLSRRPYVGMERWECKGAKQWHHIHNKGLIKPLREFQKGAAWGAFGGNLISRIYIKYLPPNGTITPPKKIKH